MSTVLEELDRILKERLASGDPESSYVARLSGEGLDRILQKLSEEATETLLAAKAAERSPEELDKLVCETTDLWFHSLVTLAYLGGDSAAVLEEMRRRLHTSGLAEKAARTKKKR